MADGDQRSRRAAARAESEPVRRACDRILGAGALVAFDPVTLLVDQVSANAESVFGLGEQVVGASVTGLVPVSTAHTLTTLTRSVDVHRPAMIEPAMTGRRGRAHELLLHVHQGLAILEALTPEGEVAPNRSWVAEMTRARERLSASESFEEACGPTLDLLARWTSYARAGVLELKADGRLHPVAGNVDADRIRPSPELLAFLKAGRARIVSDRSLGEVDLIPPVNARLAARLDVSSAGLQPLFPCEIEEGSAAPQARWLLPLRVGGRLWGVVVAENADRPVLLRYSMRTMIVALSQSLSSRLWGYAQSGAMRSSGAIATEASRWVEDGEAASKLSDLETLEVPRWARWGSATPSARERLAAAAALQRQAAHDLALAVGARGTEDELEADLLRIEAAAVEISDFTRALRRAGPPTWLSLTEVADELRTDAGLSIEAEDREAQVWADRHALAYLLSGLCARLPTRSGWSLGRAESAEPTLEPSGPRLSVRARTPVPTGGRGERSEGPPPGEPGEGIELLEVLARRVGAQVGLSPDGTEGWIALAPPTG